MISRLTLVSMHAVRRGAGVCLVVATLVLAGSVGAVPAIASTGHPVWDIQSQAQPTTFSNAEAAANNDRYLIQLENIGTAASSGTVTVADRLPPGVTTTATPFNVGTIAQWACSTGAGQSVVTCTSTRELSPPVAFYENFITAVVPNPIAIPVAITTGQFIAGTLTNSVTVYGGGALQPVSVNVANPVNVPPASPFGVSYSQTSMVASSGASHTQAGGHPYAVTVDTKDDQQLGIPGSTNNAFGAEIGDTKNYTWVGSAPKTVVADLPLGLVGDPQAAPECPRRLLLSVKGCPVDTAVGSLAIQGTTGSEQPTALFNLVPEPGYAAQFGLFLTGVQIVLDGTIVHTDGGYALRVVAEIPNLFTYTPTGFSATFYGNPARTFFSAMSAGEKAEVEAKEKTEAEGVGAPFLKGSPAFLSAPADCAASEAARTLTLHADSWTLPAQNDSEPLHVSDFSEPGWASSASTLPGMTGCSSLGSVFAPSFAFTPTPAGGSEGGTTQADEPSAYSVDLKVPQDESQEGLAAPELRNVSVTLPEGLAISPSAGSGLEGCTEAQLDVASEAPGSCPLPSKIGTVEVFTPLLPAGPEGSGQLQGSVYLEQPRCSPCTSADASEGRVFGVFLEVEDRERGVDVKLPGTVSADPSTGRLTATFRENPQLPFSELKLHFKGGPRTPLANPQTCGAYTTSTLLEPWGAPEAPDVTSSSSFNVDWDGHGGSCPASLPFAPAFSAGTVSPAAGAFSPFVLSFSRRDREQDLAGLSVTLPQGLLGKLADVPLCGSGRANAGTCSAASEIGSVSALAGPGPDPLSITGGRTYLTTGYGGQPFGLSIVVPAVAGPFNLGNVVVRAAIHINPETAQVTVKSDPLPQLVDGVPVRLRQVNVDIDRPDFTLNATNCASQQITGTITGTPVKGGEAAAGESVSSPYAANGCASLPFEPSLTASTEGAAGPKGGGASLLVKVAQKQGEANIHKVDLTLPKALPARLTTLQQACTEAQFAANPAGCPAASVIGTATAVTPLLNLALTGPAYLVSHGGAAFPDVEFVLQGEGVQILLDGKTDIKNGITYSKFETVPDAPISSFETNLPEGPHSVLASPGGNLCGQSLQMPTTITGQNGAVHTRSTQIAVTGCGKPTVQVAKTEVDKSAVAVTVKTSTFGTVTISGKYLKTTVKKNLVPGLHQITVALTKTGRAARKHHSHTTLRAGLTVTSQPTVAKTTKVKL